MSNGNDFNIDDFLENFDKNLDDEVKNSGNQKGSKKSKFSSSKKESGFSVHIEDEKKDFVDDEEGYIPAYNGEIYFANHTPLRKKEEPKPEEKPSIKEKAKKRTNQIPIFVDPREKEKTREEKKQERLEKRESEQQELEKKRLEEIDRINAERTQLKRSGTPTGVRRSNAEQKVTFALVLKAAGIRLKRRFKLIGLKLKELTPAFTAFKIKLIGVFGRKPKNDEEKPEGTPEIEDVSSQSDNKKLKSSRKSIKNKYRKRTLLAIACSFVLAVVLSAVAISCVNDILAINRDTEKIVTVTIPSDATTSKVIRILDKEGLITNSLFCNVIAKLQGFRSDNYIPGIYYVTPSMGLEGMLLHFKSAQTTGETVRLTFPEGYNVDQIMEKLEKYEVCTSQIFKQTMRDVDFSSEYDFIKAIDDKNDRYHYLEGYLYPDTYDFYVGENAASVIRKFLDNFNEKWTDEYQEKANKINMTMDEVITLASIIQKEAYGAEQMPDISSVIHNRLDNSALYPTLQCDCTKVYIEDYIDKYTDDKALVGELTDRYSTKRCVGLPVGAICNPGNDAILAALEPNDTNYYFFLHDKNKKLYLATNDAQQQQNFNEAMRVNEE